MKKLLLILAILFGGIIVLFLSLGLSVSNIKSNADVGVGIAAKLGCSSRYMSAFTSGQIIDDLKSYSGAIAVIDLHFDDVAKVATASIFGLNKVSATFRPGLGCTLDIGDTSSLDDVEVDAASKTTSLPIAIDPDLQTMLDQVMSTDEAGGYNTRALTVVHKGQVVAERYAEGMSSETPHLGWSMGKSVTSLLIGHLVMSGALSADQTELFSEWQDERKDIALEDLLQMASGLYFDETYAPGSDATHMLFSVHDGSAIPRDQPLQHPRGTHMSYSSGTTALLSRIVVEKLGGPSATYPHIYEVLLRPMGIHSLILEPDPSGVFVGSSYVYGTAYDWARAGLIYTNGGELNGIRIVTPEWIEASQQPNGSSNDRAYGYQVWLNSGEAALRWSNLPKDAFAMMGNRGQRVVMIPSLDLVIVRLGWSALPYPTDDRFSGIVAALD